MMGEDDLIEALKALAHPLRLRIPGSLTAGERHVGEIEQMTGKTRPGLSRQLSVLRKAELVDTCKEARLVFYSIATGQAGAAIAALAALAPRHRGYPEAPTPLRTPAPDVANFARTS